MFKKTVSIFLISLFILTQYGRQVTYFQCKFENFNSKSNTPVCDCEKNNGSDLAKDENKLPPQKTHLHVSLDEYYVLNEHNYSSITKDPSFKFSNRPVSFLSSFGGNIFHPPQG
jgi:hypothetical protein